MKNLKRYIAIVVFATLVGVFAALSLKAAIGVSAWDALTQTFSDLIHIKVGTMGIILNCSCIVGQIIILKKDFKPIQLLQAAVSIVLGLVINFMLYEVYTFELTAYWQNITLLIVAYIFMAMFVGAVMTLNIVTFALEGLCMALERITPFEFAKIRQGVDVVSIILCFILSFALKLPIAVREGTIIGMLMFAPLMGQFMKIENKLFKKWGLID